MNLNDIIVIVIGLGAVAFLIISVTMKRRDIFDLIKWIKNLRS